MKVNGTLVTFPAHTRLLDIIAHTIGRDLREDGTPADGTRLGMAVAVNEQVVPRSQWATTILHTNDDVELVTAVQGG